MRLLRRLRALFRPGFSADLAEEIRHHQEMQRADGLDGAAAARAFGNDLKLREMSREAWGWTWLDRLGQDLRIALRQMRRAPGSTALAVLILALGIGANTAVFSVLNAAVLRPLPYPHPEQIVAVDGGTVASKDYPAHLFSSIATYEIGQVNLAEGTGAERVQAAEVSSMFFSLFGMLPRGRGFLPEEQALGHSRVAVVSDALARQLGGGATMLGRTLSVNGRATTVIGVMPPGFDFPQHAQLWLPLPHPWSFAGESLSSSNVTVWFNLARLRPGVTASQARRELIAVAARPPGNLQEAQQYVSVMPLAASLLGDAKPMLWMLLGAVGLVLLIACADVANLQLTRAMSRQKEVALRAALGASRARLLRQNLTESLVLAALGGGAGVLLAGLGLPALRALLPVSLPLFTPVALDGRVLAFSAAAALGSGLVFGLFPTLHACGVDLRQAVEGAGSGRERSWLRHVRSGLAIAEVALALILLTGAGLLIESFARLSTVNPGFQPERLLTARIELTAAHYRSLAASAFYGQVLSRVAALPGVEGVALSSTLPLVRGEVYMLLRFDVEEPSPAAADQRDGTFAVVSPDYFQVMGIPLLAGRAFAASDGPNAPPVAILSQALARALWSGQNPLGKHVSLPANPGGKPKWLEVVGVVGDTSLELGEKPIGYLYQPLAQEVGYDVYLEIRTERDVAGMAAAIRHAVAEVDPREPVSDFATEEQHLADEAAPPRFRTILLGLFAALALGLSAAGIFGVMAYWAARRTAEIGIRIALGAHPAAVLRLVLGQGMRLVGIGIAVGLAGALALAQLLEHDLYGVAPRDPAILAAASVVMAGAGVLACWWPARRAARLDPLAALRRE